MRVRTAVFGAAGVVAAFVTAAYTTRSDDPDAAALMDDLASHLEDLGYGDTGEPPASAGIATEGCDEIAALLGGTGRLDGEHDRARTNVFVVESDRGLASIVARAIVFDDEAAAERAMDLWRSDRATTCLDDIEGLIDDQEPRNSRSIDIGDGGVGIMMTGEYTGEANDGAPMSISNVAARDGRTVISGASTTIDDHPIPGGVYIDELFAELIAGEIPD